MDAELSMHNVGLKKRALIESNNVAYKSLNFGGDITP